jgi:hypothetical protein
MRLDLLGSVTISGGDNSDNLDYVNYPSRGVIICYLRWLIVICVDLLIAFLYNKVKAKRKEVLL